MKECMGLAICSKQALHDCPAMAASAFAAMHAFGIHASMQEIKCLCRTAASAMLLLHLPLLVLLQFSFSSKCLDCYDFQMIKLTLQGVFTA